MKGNKTVTNEGIVFLHLPCSFENTSRQIGLKGLKIVYHSKGEFHLDNIFFFIRL